MKNMQPEPNINQGNKAMNEYINWKTEHYVRKEIAASQTGALIET